MVTARRVGNRKICQPEIFYFAYGSNLDWQQFRQHCPMARYVDRALLPGHRLAFTRYSVYWQGGVADVMPQPGAQVWGVIYQLRPRSLAALDAYEGYYPGRRHNAYLRQEAVVWRQGNPELPTKVWLYRAVWERDFIAPSHRYKETIRRGAVFWGLPHYYLKEVIDPIPCLEDLEITV